MVSTTHSSKKRNRSDHLTIKCYLNLETADDDTLARVNGTSETRGDKQKGNETETVEYNIVLVILISPSARKKKKEKHTHGQDRNKKKTYRKCSISNTELYDPVNETELTT